MGWKIRVSRRRLVVLLLCVLLLLATPAVLFVVNGLLLAWGETPRLGTTGQAPAAEDHRAIVSTFRLPSTEDASAKRR